MIASTLFLTLVVDDLCGVCLCVSAIGRYTSNDGEAHKDKNPFASRKRNAPTEDISNEDIAESGDNQEAAQLSKAKAMDAIAEAASVLKDGEIILIHSGSELDEKLDAASKASRLSVLYFTTTWCGPCRYVGPVFTSLAGKYPKVVFLKVDIDETREVAAEWDIRSIPTFIFVRNGEEVDELVTVDKNVLKQKIAQHAS
ncbi:TPR repeat-containing thioredoxin TDX-like [Salvia hispanica]|uniref:TPR repeat-containing thioredoxin TDX-like n=1 Tax=Salvia hispanica TaxID=49212 RepID=UPI002009DB79|nr:TPR repeat-containing thioredoxin TDX-like [Salvia hispanica]